MAAMIWDEQAQAYTESETPMKYDPTAESWTGTTGMAWDNEAQAWTEKWGTKVSAYVYGAVGETVTIRKNGIVVATVQTDSSGRSTEMVSLDTGTYDMTGSVSGWTEEQTVDSSTTKFRAMPDNVYYWYGYKSNLGGNGFDTTTSVSSEHYSKIGSLSILTNSLKGVIPATYQSSNYMMSQLSINLSNYSKIKAIFSNPNKSNYEKECDISSYDDSRYIWMTAHNWMSEVGILYVGLIPNKSSGFPEGIGASDSNIPKNSVCYIHAIWFE